MNLPEYFNTLDRNDNYYVGVSPNPSPIKEKDTVEVNNISDLIVISAIAAMGISILLGWRFISRIRAGFGINWSQAGSTKASDELPKLFDSPTSSNCIQCRFYNNNHYLKCAVRPSIVLTKEAQKCLVKLTMYLLLKKG